MKLFRKKLPQTLFSGTPKNSEAFRQRVARLAAKDRDKPSALGTYIPSIVKAAGTLLLACSLASCYLTNGVPPRPCDCCREPALPKHERNEPNYLKVAADHIAEFQAVYANEAR